MNGTLVILKIPTIVNTAPVVTALVNWAFLENIQPIRAKEHNPEMNTKTDSLKFDDIKYGQNERTCSGTMSAARPA
jgi:hypothetical protein